ncbi:WD repeat-containing protein 97 isoform X2 [Notamacropus eugenii]|uniref:WD repeat-containing protein 97 isoform X2 n=1 Tax=Notamacropus eugenii TaxID=9315 RepID=UPI003B66D02D
MDPKNPKVDQSKGQSDSKTDQPEMAEEPPQELEVENQDNDQVRSAEDVTTTTTTGSLSSNELWWSIMPFSRARRLWLVLRAGLYRLVERMKRAEMQVAHLTHGLEFLRRLEMPTGLLAVAQDVESSRLVLLDGAGQLYLHAEDGWARGRTYVPADLTGLVALVGFQHLGQNPGRFLGWGPEGMVVLSENLQLLSRNSLDPSQMPVCCALLPGKGMVAIGEEGGRLSIWEFRGGGRRLVLAATIPSPPSQGQSYPVSRIAVDMVPPGVFPRCFAVRRAELLTYDLATCSITDVRRKLHKTIISDVVYCDAAEVVVTASRDSTVKVWDADWQIRSVFVGHTGPVTALTVLPRSVLVLSASQDMTLRTWNLETAQQVGEVSLRSHSDAVSGVRQDTGNDDEMSPPSTPSNYCETVCRLWAPGRPGAPLLAQGLAYLELWMVRELHHPLVSLSSCVQSLELAPSLPQPERDILPQRLVGRCADGTVRIFSAVTGKMISALLLAPGEMAVATAYCLPREVLLVLTQEGILIRANAARSPMPVVRRLQPLQLPEARPSCLHLISHIVDQARAYSSWEGVRNRGGELRKKSWMGTTWEDRNRFLPVLGYMDGTIAVLDWQSCRKLYHTEAHGPGSTTTIASSLQSLVTAGTDMTVKLWRVFPYSEESLTLIRTFFCYQSTVALCTMGSRVTVAFEDPSSATYSLVQYGSADGNDIRHDHSPLDDPTDHITGLCCCPYLKLYASSSLDCTLRIWTQDNKLLRLMHLNMPPEAITFCNDKGDLILSLGSQLCLLSHKLYLPTSYLVKVLCQKLPKLKEDLPLPLTDLELLTPEELKRIKRLKALPRVRMKQVIKQEYLEAEYRQMEIEEACARLAARDEEVRSLALGQVEPLTQLLLTPQMRMEAFHNYLQVVYGSRLDSVIPLSQRILQSCKETSGFFPSSKTQPRRLSTKSKMPSPIRFPGHIPNSVAMQQLWKKTDLKGVGELVTLKSESFEILEREMDTMWLPWGTSKKKEKAWFKKNLGLEVSPTQHVLHLDSSLLQQKISETVVPEELHEEESEKELEKEQVVPEVSVTQELHTQLEEFLSSMEVPETWDPASTYVFAEGSQPIPEFLISLLNQEWFQKYFPDFNLEEVMIFERLREKKREKEREKDQLVPEEVLDSERLREKEREEEREKEREKAQLEVLDSEGLREKEREEEQEKEREKAQLVYEAYPECFTVEGVATLLLKILEQSNWEDGTKVMMMLVDMMPHLGTDFRKKLQQLLLKLLNKEPPPNLVDKIEKKFVMTALQMLMVVSLGSRDVVLELMSYFLYSPPRCRPSLKKLLEELGLKDPHNFLFKEMVTWAEGKDLTSKAALRGRCGQKLEYLIKNFKTHLQKTLLLPTWEEEEEISVSPQEHRIPVLPTATTESPHKFPHPPTPTRSAKYKTISRSRAKHPREPSPKDSPKISPKDSPKLSPKDSPKHSPKHSPKLSPKLSPKHSPRLSPKHSPKLSPKLSPKSSPKLSPKPSPKLSPKHSPMLSPKLSTMLSPKLSLKPSPKLSPDIPITTPTSLSPLHSGRSRSETFFSSQIPTPPDSRVISPPSFRLLSFSQPPPLRRAISEPGWVKTSGNLPARHSAPAATSAGWLPFLDYEYPTVESPTTMPQSPQEIDIEVTPIDALNFFCEQQLKAHKEWIKMRRAMSHARPNTIVMQPRRVMLSTYQSTRGRKILRLQERGSSLTALDATRTTNFQRARYRMGTISRSVKLPLPRVEPIPFPPVWPPPSRPLPPMILEDSLQRYFLPKLARTENYH